MLTVLTANPALLFVIRMSADPESMLGDVFVCEQVGPYRTEGTHRAGGPFFLERDFQVIAAACQDSLFRAPSHYCGRGGVGVLQFVRRSEVMTRFFVLPFNVAGFSTGPKVLSSGSTQARTGPASGCWGAKPI